ncbi:MAG: holo-ACP synthase [Candidatus Binatia bacterium]
MIIAIGTDAIEVERVQRAVDHARWGARFRRRVFTADEVAYCLKRRRHAESFAARFAAKEAVMKALGTGYAKGVWWRDIEVVRTTGRPTIRLHGGALARAEALGIAHWHLTLTHTAGQALATVIAEGTSASAA